MNYISGIKYMSANVLLVCVCVCALLLKCMYVWAFLYLCVKREFITHLKLLQPQTAITDDLMCVCVKSMRSCLCKLNACVSMYITCMR